MSDLQLFAAATAAAAGAGLSAAAGAVYGVPSAAIVAAATGALVPALLLDPEPFWAAARHWAGGVSLALVATAVVLHVTGLNSSLAGPLAGLLAAFARDLYSLARGQLPPLVAALRERITGHQKDA